MAEPSVEQLRGERGSSSVPAAHTQLDGDSHDSTAAAAAVVGEATKAAVSVAVELDDVWEKEPGNSGMGGDNLTTSVAEDTLTTTEEDMEVCLSVRQQTKTSKVCLQKALENMFWFPQLFWGHNKW